MGRRGCRVRGEAGGVAGMGAEEAEIYERVKARVRDNLDAAKRFISLNINSSDPDMRKLAEGTRDTLEHWFTKGRELKSAYLKTPEDDHMKELQAKYPDNWFDILRARSLDLYKTPFSHAPGVYEIIKGENERLGLPVRPPKFYGLDSDSTAALDEDLKKRLRELRYFPESNKDPPSYKEEKVHPDVARLEDSVEEAKRVAVLYKGADRQVFEASDIEAQLPEAPQGPVEPANFEKKFDIAQSAALRLKLLTESLPDDQKGKMMGPKEIDETVIDVLRGVAIDNIQINDRNVAKDKQARDESNARLKEAKEIIRSAQDSERKRKQNEKDERDKAESEAKARAERERRQSSPPVQSQPGPGPNETGRATDVKIPETKTTRIEKRENTTSDIWQELTPDQRRTIQSIASQQEDDIIQVLLDHNPKPSDPNKSHETRAEAVGMLARGGAPVKEPESETRTQRPANTDTTPPLPPPPRPIQRPPIPLTSWPWLRNNRGDATRARNAPRGIDVFYSLQHPAQGDPGVVVQPQTDRTTRDSGYIVSTPPQPTEAPKVTVREPTFKEKFRESVKDLTHDQREAMLKSLLVRMLADAIKRNEETRENTGHATPGREEMSRRDLLKKVLAWKTREKIPEHLQRWLTATTTTAPKTPAVDPSIADSGVRAAPNTPAADATTNYRGVKQVTQDQRDQAFADVMAKTLGLSDTVKKAQEKAKELEGMLAESEKGRKEGEERLGRTQQALDKKGEELTKVQERIAALEADHSARTKATRKEITELQSKEIDLKAAIERLEKRHADITKELQKVTAAKEAAERGLREANDRIQELASDLSGARDSLAEEQRRAAKLHVLSLVEKLKNARVAADADREKHAGELNNARSELAAAKESVRTLTAEQGRLAGQLRDALAGKQRAEEETAAEKTRSAATEKQLQSELDGKEELKAREAELRRESERVRELENTAGLHDAEEARLRTALGDKKRQLDEAKRRRRPPTRN
eukprot:jgi/Mesvir1/19197/Mv11514-RA.1